MANLEPMNATSALRNADMSRPPAPFYSTMTRQSKGGAPDVDAGNNLFSDRS
jgi:hypothetical protein